MLKAQEQAYGAENAALPQVFEFMRGDLQSRYNEVVLESDHWMAAMPTAVDAIFVHAGSSDEQVERARSVQSNFVDDYSLQGEAVPPLLVYDGQREPPFRLLSEEEEER